MPASSLLSEEEKIVIGDFKVGKAMLLMIDHALSGIKEKKNVNLLKKVIAQCISSLQGSKVREVAKHKQWTKLLTTEIKSNADACARLTGQTGALGAKIIALQKLINAEKLKKKNALAASNRERSVCLSQHKNFVASVKDFTSEIDAVNQMIKLVKQPLLWKETVAIRDETEKTKHGVKESLGGSLKGCWSSRLNGKYVRQQHGKTNECYSFAVAKAKCAAASDCGAIATQSNVCGGKYRVTHGGPTLVYYSHWKRYNLWAYTFSKDKVC